MTDRLVQKFYFLFREQNIKDFIAKSYPSLIAKVAGLVSALFISVLLGRNLGVADFGTFELANKIATFILVVAIYGTENIALRETAISYAKNDYRRVSNVVYSIERFNIIISLVIVITSIFLVPYLVPFFFDNEDLVLPLQVLVVSVFFQTLTRTYSSVIVGLNRVWQGNLFNQSLGLIISSVFFGAALLFEFQITLVNAVGIYLLSRLFVVCISRLYWRRVFLFRIAKKEFISEILRPANKLFVLNGSVILSASVSAFFLGSMIDRSSVGLFLIAERLASLVSITHHIASSVLSPKLASFYAQNRNTEIQELLKKVVFVLASISVFVLAVYLLFGQKILALWGGDFKDAYIIMIILSVGQVFNVITGPTGALLIMAKKDGLIRNLSVMFLIISVFLHLVLIAYFGVIGAAIATLIVNVSENLVKLILVKRKLGISLKFINLN